MIKIINGVFGYNDGNVVIPKTPKDDPFEAGAEIEARLVKEGVAEYVDKDAEEKAEAPEEKADDAEEAKADSLEVFTKAQLIEKFNELGLEGNPNRMNKAQLIEAIENAPVDGEAAEEDDDAPSFGEDDGVVE